MGRNSVAPGEKKPDKRLKWFYLNPMQTASVMNHKLKRTARASGTATLYVKLNTERFSQIGEKTALQY